MVQIIIYNNYTGRSPDSIDSIKFAKWSLDSLYKGKTKITKESDREVNEGKQRSDSILN